MQTSEIYVCFSLQMPSTSTAKRLTEALKCERWSNRRDALADPFQMSMPQVTRGKIGTRNKTQKDKHSQKANSLFPL